MELKTNQRWALDILLSPLSVESSIIHVLYLKKNISSLETVILKEVFLLYMLSDSCSNVSMFHSFTSYYRSMTLQDVDNWFKSCLVVQFPAMTYLW